MGHGAAAILHPQGCRGARPQAAFHSSFVMCVSRSQTARQFGERLAASPGAATLERAALVNEVVTVAMDHGATACTAGAGSTADGGIATVAVVAGVACCSARGPKEGIRGAGSVTVSAT